MKTIPKRIIQTARSAELPMEAQASVCNLRLLNPDYEYLFFDNPAVEQFIQEHYPEYKSVFDNFPHRIQKYDFFRYLAVYHFGGFYFDTDVFLVKSLDDLLHNEAVFPFEGLTLSDYLRQQCKTDWQIGNYAFGSVSGHSFLKSVIENCVRAQREPQWVTPLLRGTPYLSREAFQILFTTGPGLISRTLVENKKFAKTVTILFPDDVCDRDGWNVFGTFGVHLMKGSWRSGRMFLLRKLANYFECARLNEALIQSKALGRSRSLAGRYS
jgi:mannosyltransferase OCH1-like enzyme